MAELHLLFSTTMEMKGFEKTMKPLLFVLSTHSNSSVVSYITEPEGSGCQLTLEEAEGTINSPKRNEILSKDVNCIFDIMKTQEDQCGIRLSREPISFIVCTELIAKNLACFYGTKLLWLHSIGCLLKHGICNGLKDRFGWSILL